MRRIYFIALALLVLSSNGCDLDAPVDPFDLEGPQGRVLGPGPWTVAVLTDGRAPRLSYSLNNEAFDALPLVDVGGDQYIGMLPARMPGESFRYYAVVGSHSMPPGGAAGARVVDVLSAIESAAVSDRPCRLDFLRPDVDRFAEAVDSAPQAGIQQSFVLTTNLDDGHPVRLRVAGTGYASQVRAGFVAFLDVTLPQDLNEVVVDAMRGAFTCQALLTIEGSERENLGGSDASELVPRTISEQSLSGGQVDSPVAGVPSTDVGGMSTTAMGGADSLPLDGQEPAPQ